MIRIIRIVKFLKINYPYFPRILYWADAKVDKIISFDLKTNTKTDLIARDMHPFGLAVWQDYLYWSG